MIVETVYFNLPQGISREEVLALYRKTAPGWSKNEDLLHKYYFFDESQNLGGGVYIWKTLEAATRWHGPEYQANIRALYGGNARIALHDTLLVVDNVRNCMSEPTKG